MPRWSRAPGSGRQQRPGIGDRVVDLVGIDRVLIGIAPADRVHLAVHDDRTGRSARSRERCQRTPHVGRGVVFVNVCHRTAVRDPNWKPPTTMIFPSNNRRAGM